MQHLSPTVRGLKPPRITAPKIVNDKNGHELPVNCMAWSCDGHYLATGSDDKTVRIWQYKAAAAAPFSLVKVDGSPILSSADEKDLYRKSLAEHSGITACAPITSLAFSPRHPEILAVASHVDGWQPATHGVEGGLQGLQVVQRIGSREGRAIDRDKILEQVSASRPRVTIWNIKTRQPITTILLSHNPVSMTFHPSSYQLLIVCMDKSAVDYAVLCWQQSNSISDAEANSVFESPLSREVPPTTGKDDGEFVPYLQDDTATGSAERRKRKQDVESKQDRQKGVESDGDEGWTVRRDIELVLKDRVAEMKSYGLENGVSELNGACFSPCGTQLYTGNHDGTVHIWHYPVTPELSHHIHGPRDVFQPVDTSKGNTSVEPPVTSESANADRASDEGDPHDMVKQSEEPSDTNAGDLIEMSMDMLETEPKSIKWLRHYETNQGCVNCIDMDPRRRFFVTGGSEGLVSVSGLADGVSYRALASYTEEIKFAKPSWDGEYLAIGGGTDSVDVISLVDGGLVQRIEGGSRSGSAAGRKDGSTVRSLAWSPARLVFVLAAGDAQKPTSGHWSFVRYF